MLSESDQRHLPLGAASYLALRARTDRYDGGSGCARPPNYRPEVELPRFELGLCSAKTSTLPLAQHLQLVLAAAAVAVAVAVVAFPLPTTVLATTTPMLLYLLPVTVSAAAPVTLLLKFHQAMVAGQVGVEAAKRQHLRLSARPTMAVPRGNTAALGCNHGNRESDGDNRHGKKERTAV